METNSEEKKKTKSIIWPSAFAGVGVAYFGGGGGQCPHVSPLYLCMWWKESHSVLWSDETHRSHSSHTYLTPYVSHPPPRFLIPRPPADFGPSPTFNEVTNPVCIASRQNRPTQVRVSDSQRSVERSTVHGVTTMKVYHQKHKFFVCLRLFPIPFAESVVSRP